MNPLPFNLEAVIAACVGNLAIVPSVLDEFAKEMTSILERIDASVASCNTAEAAKAAHKLKGSAALLGAKSLRDIAAQIEATSLAGDISEIRQALAQLHAEIRQCVDYVPSATAQIWEMKRRENKCAC